MIPGLNPKLLKQAMKRMNIKQEEIEAKEVIIKCKDKNIVIRNPKVSKVNVMGQESLQITGNMEEESGEDIKIIMEQTNCSEEEAKKALEKADGDLAASILALKSQ